MNSASQPLMGKLMIDTAMGSFLGCLLYTSDAADE